MGQYSLYSRPTPQFNGTDFSIFSKQNPEMANFNHPDPTGYFKNSPEAPKPLYSEIFFIVNNN